MFGGSGRIGTASAATNNGSAVRKPAAPTSTVTPASSQVPSTRPASNFAISSRPTAPSTTVGIGAVSRPGFTSSISASRSAGSTGIAAGAHNIGPSIGSGALTGSTQQQGVPSPTGGANSSAAGRPGMSGSSTATAAYLSSPGAASVVHGFSNIRLGAGSSQQGAPSTSLAGQAGAASAPAYRGNYGLDAGPGRPVGAGAGAVGASSRPTNAGSVANRPGSSGQKSLQKNELMRFQLRDLHLSTTVGTGTFGRVRIVQHRATKAWYALKILKKSEIIRLKQVDHIKSEVKILSQISHPFIVNMLGFLADDKRLYMLFDYVPGGELFSHLRREGKFSEAASRLYAAEIVLAFEYLHNFNIVYRDLKPENLLLTSKGHVKITDFGFAKVVDDRTYTLCGTPEYLAPEIIQSKGHNKGVDWWAIGILIFEMLAGFPPFFDENPYGIYQKILGGKVDWPKHFSMDARDLLKKLLTADRTRRLGCLFGGARDIKEHPWFKSIDWTAVYNLAVSAPYVPRVKDANDTSNFDDYPDSDGDTAEKLGPKDAELFAELDNF